jgi:hypothetical protein
MSANLNTGVTSGLAVIQEYEACFLTIDENPSKSSDSASLL